MSKTVESKQSESGGGMGVDARGVPFIMWRKAARHWGISPQRSGCVANTTSSYDFGSCFGDVCECVRFGIVSPIRRNSEIPISQMSSSGRFRLGLGPWPRRESVGRKRNTVWFWHSISKLAETGLLRTFLYQNIIEDLQPSIKFIVFGMHQVLVESELHLARFYY